MAFSRSSARASLSARLTLASCARCNRLSTTTAAATIDVTPKTCLPLMPRRTVEFRVAGSGFRIPGSEFGDSPRTQPQLVQLVVKSLQADPENLRRASFVVTRVLERHHDESPFGFFDGDAWRERNLRVNRDRRLVDKSRRKVLGLDERTRRQNRAAL